MKRLAFAALLLSLSAFANQDYCQELEIGKSFAVNFSNSKSKTGVEQKYSLKRDSEYEYSAYVNVNYKLKGTLKSSPEISQTFRDRANDCFRQKEHKLVDEMGRKIKLHLFDPSIHTDVPAPKSISVNIQNTEPRSDSRNYYVTASCATIIHETLHLMGLMDEYQEEWMGLNPNPILKIFKPYVDSTRNGPAFDCRAIGPESSIMRNNHHMDYFDQVFYSGHVDTIIHPNCAARNNDYYDCSRLAYKTSKQNGSAKGCGEIKEICKTKEWVLSKSSPERTEYQSISMNQSEGISEAGIKNVTKKSEAVSKQ